ncbi:MAG: NADH:flavin oxidoreductase [Pseudomonadota bacterium]
MSLDSLFTPYRINSLELPNRIAMAPMTREFSPGGVPREDVAAYYRRRAEGGVGLIVTEGTLVNDPVAGLNERIPHFYGEEALAGWQRVVNEVHAAGGKIFPQLWHGGTMRKPEDTDNPELPSAGPSGLRMPGKQVAEPMSETYIEQVIEAFAESAASAMAMGFDGVEIHGAHGYLIDQFFWRGLNQREDAWGGSMENRSRFAIEIIKAVRSATSSEFPVTLRYSQWKQQDFEARLAHSPQELEDFLLPLADAGLDGFHCSTRRYWEPEFEGSDLNLAGWTKKITGKTSITVGSVGLSEDFIGAFAGKSSEKKSIDDLVARLDAGEFDLIAVGRAILQDASWPNKVRDGRHEQIDPFKVEALATLA